MPGGRECQAKERREGTGMNKGISEIYLRAWGAVEKERLVTGDKGAIPSGFKMEDLAGPEVSRNGGNRIGRSVQDAHCDVERVLGHHRGTLRALLMLKYRDCTEQVRLWGVYKFKDGTTVRVERGDPHPEQDGRYIEDHYGWHLDPEWRKSISRVMGAETFEALSTGTLGLFSHDRRGENAIGQTAIKCIELIIDSFSQEVEWALSSAEDRQKVVNG